MISDKTKQITSTTQQIGPTSYPQVSLEQLSLSDKQLCDGRCDEVEHRRDRLFTLSTEEVAGYVEQSIGNTNSVVRHPLGFIRVPLPGLCDEQSDINLHIWPAHLKLNDGNDIHYHVFEMRSRILAGGITDVMYGSQTVPRGTEGALWRYEVRYDHGQQDHGMLDTGISVALTELARRDMNPGENYFVPRGVFHKTILKPDQTTLTLIDRWGHDHSLPCYVLCQPNSPERFVYEPKLVEWDEAWSLMQEAVTSLRSIDSQVQPAATKSIK